MLPPRILPLVLFAALVPLAAWACDTPVYRYALYRWPPSPYRLLVCSDAASAADSRALLDRAIAARQHDGQQANLEVHFVDTSDQDWLESLPPAVKQSIAARREDALPWHLLLSPHGNVLFSGRLADDDLPALLDSPARRRIAELLAEGHPGVLLLLSGRDEQANSSVEQTVRQAIARTTPPSAPEQPGFIPGLLPVETAADLAAAARAEADPSAATPDALPVGFVTVARDDPREAWFVRMLLGVEDDLADFDEAMVFAVYGRGRVMEPCLGEGITADNISALFIRFMHGACSCEVKEQNPGMDMLVRFDWDAAAARVAQRFGPEEGAQDLLLAEMTGQADPRLVAAADALLPPVAAPTATPQLEPVTDLIHQAATSAQSAADQDPTASLFALLGLGVVVVALVLIVATVVLLRPR